VSVYHIELRRFPHRSHGFNLSQPRLLEEIVGPWRRGERVEFGERKWEPAASTLTVLEGPPLEPSEMSMGRGWNVAVRRCQDVTARELGGAPPVDGVEQRLLARCRAADRPQPVVLAWELAESDAHAASASERLALAERAVRMLLSAGSIELWADGQPVRSAEAIDRVLRERVSWTAGSGAAEMRLGAAAGANTR